MLPYVPLRTFSSFTMLEGAVEPKAIAKQAAKLGFPAIAMTDRNGLYGVMPFGDGCVAEGVQPIVGTTLAVARPGEGGLTIDWLVLLAQDEAGYDNLCKLVSAAHLDRPINELPHIPFAMLATHSAGLIALTAGGEGAVARHLAEGQRVKAEDYLDRLTGDRIEEGAETGLLEMAYARDLPIVATNPSCYAEPHFHAAHDALLCIANSTYVENKDRPTSSPEAWMKPGSAIEALFPDLPEAIANSAIIAQRCAVAAPQRRPILPRLGDDEDEALGRDAKAGLDARLARLAELGTAPADPTTYYARLDFEIDVITRMGFAGYFLIVADFIKWAKNSDIPVGPGRGSGAGSIVAWSLLITDLDPMALDLLFERFPNACRCPISTSTSAKLIATRSLATSRPNMAATGWRKSSLLVG
jgi:DNA polymerase-3 subunit alpha